MTKTLTTLFLLFLSGISIAQTVDYGLNYDETNCRYEAYAVASANIKPTQSASSVFTIVLPGDATDSAILNLTSHSPSASAWGLADQAYTSGGDYYKVELNSTAAYGKISAGDTITLFYFEISNSVCVSVRPWESNDPSDPLSQGDDYSNVFNIRNSDHYNSNVNSSVAMVDPIINYMVPNCFGTTHGIDADATTQAKAASCGSGSIMYSWSGPNNFSASTLDITVADNPASIGSYTLTVTDAFGCEASNSLTLDSSNCFTAPVPVTLVSFKGENVNYKNILHWTTATEINNSHFEVLRKTGSGSFESIGRLNSKASGGNSFGLLEYTFTDFAKQPLGLDVYYMLKQVDFDNTTEFFGPISVGTQKTNKITVYPNPINNIANVAGLNDKVDYKITVIDLLGNTILNSEIDNKNSKIDLSTLRNGVYYVFVEEEKGIKSSTKIIISH